MPANTSVLVLDPDRRGKLSIITRKQVSHILIVCRRDLFSQTQPSPPLVLQVWPDPERSNADQML